VSLRPEYTVSDPAPLSEPPQAERRTATSANTSTPQYRIPLRALAPISFFPCLASSNYR